jgi:Domain of unknown function (DUF3885)
MRPAKLNENWDQSFRASPYRLRFELGGELLSNVDQPVPRFIQAFQRAQTVANALFAGSLAPSAILAAWPTPGRDTLASASDPFSTLESLGFRAPAPWCKWSASLNSGDEDEPPLDWCAIDLSEPTMRDTLLWAFIVYDMPITPKARALSWLIDFEVGVMLHAYDDRGMDVHAHTREAIEPLYRKFEAWLLDHDRPRMAVVFGE